MLCLTRKVSERIVIGNNITITVVRIDGNKVRIGIEAPDNMSIQREELLIESAQPNGRTLAVAAH